MPRNRNLQHPEITEIERSGYPRRYSDEDAETCPWCTGDFVDGERVYFVKGEYICESCFSDWVEEDISLAAIANAMHIPNHIYA